MNKFFFSLSFEQVENIHFFLGKTGYVYFVIMSRYTYTVRRYDNDDISQINQFCKRVSLKTMNIFFPSFFYSHPQTQSEKKIDKFIFFTWTLLTIRCAYELNSIFFSVVYCCVLKIYPELKVYEWNFIILLSYFEYDHMASTIRKKNQNKTFWINEKNIWKWKLKRKKTRIFQSTNNDHHGE